MKALPHTLALVALAAAPLAGCGEEEFAVPETREEQLALLEAKEREQRTLAAQIAELEAAVGGDTAAVDSRLVRARPVERDLFEREVELQATLESDEVAAVAAEVPGRVTAVLVDEGDRVQRGQAVVRLDLETLNSQLAELDASLALARDVYARYERLREQNIGTEMQYLEAQNAVERLEQQREQLVLQQAKGTLTAPISGTVESKSVNVGEFAGPGVPLMQILDARTVEVVADVPEVYLQTIERGQSVRVEFPALDDARTARITEIGRTVDPSNRTFEVRMALPNRDGLLKPNMLATAYVVDYSAPDAVAVPSATVLEEVDGREYVYVAERDDDLPAGTYRAAKRYVDVGESDTRRREITAGLEAGDLLVTEGMRALTSGQAIRLELPDAVAAGG